MAATRGNKFWKQRTKHGRDKLFSDPATLWAAFYEYIDLCDRSPYMRPELVKHQGMATEYEISLGRPYSIDGLTIYLGVSASYFRSFKANIKTKIDAKRATAIEEELLDAVEMIEQVCYTQNLEGAMVRVFDSGLVAKKHGIADNLNANVKSEGAIVVTVRDQQTADNLNDLDDIL